MRSDPEEKLVLVQIGNSRIQLAKYSDRTISEPLIIDTRTAVRSSRELLPELRKFFKSSQSGSTQPASKQGSSKQGSSTNGEIRIVSVVSEATTKLSARLAEVAPKSRIRVISHRDVPMSSKYRPQHSLGLDRLVASYGAWKRFAEPRRKGLLLIDLGTATTYNCVSPEGVFLGGAITLGIESTLHALHERTSQLPKVRGSFPKHVLANTTQDAIRSGVLFGAVASIEGMIRLLRIEAFDDEPPVVVLTGGFCELFGPHLTGIDEVAPRILLEGLAML